MTETTNQSYAELLADLEQAAQLLDSPRNARQAVIRRILAGHHERRWNTRMRQQTQDELDGTEASHRRWRQYAESLRSVIPVGPDHVRHEGVVGTLTGDYRDAVERARQDRERAQALAEKIAEYDAKRVHIDKHIADWEAFYVSRWTEPLPEDMTAYVNTAYGDVPFGSVP